MTLSVVRGTLLLARLRLAIARNSLWRSGWGRRILVVVGALLALVAVYGVFWVSNSLVAALRSPQLVDFLEQARRQGAQGLPPDPQALLARLPGLLFFFAMTLLLFTSFGALLSSLYLSGDMDLLLAAPLPMRAVFVVKFFEALLPQYGLLLGLICPALIGYGWGMGYGPTFFVAAPLLLVLAPLLPAAVAALLVMAVVRVLPARRARDIVGILGGLVGVSFYIANQFAPELIARFGGVDALARLLGLNVPLLPSAWAGAALTAAGEGRYGAALGLSALFAALALGVFAACVMLTERLYYGGWSNLAISGGRVRRASSVAARRGWLRLPGWLSPPVRAVLLKELRIFPRDLRRLQQLIFPLALAGIWIFRLLSEPFAGDQLARDFGSLGGVAISFFICLSASNSLAGTGISAEGRSFWLLRLAPITSRELLWGKLALAYLPYPLLGVPLVTALAVLQGDGPTTAARGLALLLLLGLGATAITLGFGAAYPKFDWDTPQRMWSLRTGCLAPIVYLGYIIVTVAAAVGAELLGRLALLAPWGLALGIVGWLLAVGLTAAAVYLPLTFGARRLDALDL